MRAVAIHNGHPRLRLDRRAIVALIHTLDAHAEKFRGGCPPGDLSLAFLTDPALARLHADFLADPAVTDVITFAGDPAHGLAGEICISADAAVRQGRPRQGRKTATGRKDFSDELSLYLVHGWLHLAGYDDLAPAKKKAMRAAETRAMKLLRAAGSLPGFRLVE
ncbi:MAG TPA: rRNA maturation RNase YbeY [Opitutaceae bacterium]|nr:rRNA maturation RNase YbeY [Opitutaceae bacterium]